MSNTGNRTIRFNLGGMEFEYDENKNRLNIKNHGISFRSAARVFFDYDRIEFLDDDNSYGETRYDTIGDLSAGSIGISRKTGNIIGNVGKEDILFVVYTERFREDKNGEDIEVTRLISARFATEFERGLYYGKC